MRRCSPWEVRPFRFAVCNHEYNRRKGYGDNDKQHDEGRYQLHLFAHGQSVVPFPHGKGSLAHV